jgi:hypothetical protein
LNTSIERQNMRASHIYSDFSTCHPTSKRKANLFVLTKSLRNAFVTAVLATCWVHSAHAIELPLTRVVISSAGLAQFTRSGTITGGSSVELSVRLDQVDDILKSLTVFDEQGVVGAISLPGKKPLAELFRDLPFGPDALASPTKLLNALVGAEVEIAGNVGAKGRIFRVASEKRVLPNNGGTTTRHRLTLLTDPRPHPSGD